MAPSVKPVYRLACAYKSVPFDIGSQRGFEFVTKVYVSEKYVAFDPSLR